MLPCNAEERGARARVNGPCADESSAILSTAREQDRLEREAQKTMRRDRVWSVEFVLFLFVLFYHFFDGLCLPHFIVTSIHLILLIRMPP